MSLPKHFMLWLISTLVLGVSTVSLNALETLTLAQALSIAKEHNSQMIKARMDIDAAKARYSTAKAYPNPEVNYETFKSRDGQNNYEFDASQEIELFGKRKARQSFAETNISLADTELDTVWSEVALEAKEAYYELLLMDRKRTIAQENLVLFRKLLDSVQLKYYSGMVVLSEVMRAKIELSQAENEVSLADKEFRAARAKFSLLLNKPVDYEFAAGDSLEFLQKEFDYKTLTQNAVMTNPELKTRMIIAQRNRKGVGIEKLNVFSNPRIGYVEKNEEGISSRGVSIGIGLPLWNRNSGIIEEAEIETEKAVQDVAYMKKQLEVDIYDAAIEAEGAARQVVNYRRSVEQSNEIQSQLDLQFKEGKVDFLSYLDGLRTVKNVKIGYFEAVVNYNKKVALIEKLVGKE